jgi:hypothetical protein
MLESYVANNFQLCRFILVSHNIYIKRKDKKSFSFLFSTKAKRKKSQKKKKGGKQKRISFILIFNKDKKKKKWVLCCVLFIFLFPSYFRLNFLCRVGNSTYVIVS